MALTQETPVEPLISSQGGGGFFFLLDRGAAAEPKFIYHKDLEKSPFARVLIYHRNRNEKKATTHKNIVL